MKQYKKPNTIVEYLLESTKRDPYKTAFSDENQSITYKDFLDASERIGSAISLKFRKTREPIVVLIGRNVESICAFFGISLSNNFYVPVDPAQPALRIRKIIEQVTPMAVLAAVEVSEEIRSIFSCPFLDYHEISAFPADHIQLVMLQSHCLDTDTDPLYAICTSGSTGTPKAVLVSHRSVLDFIPVCCSTFSFGASDVFGNQAPFDFDVSVKDIYSSLFCGESMYIIPKKCFTMPKRLVQTLEEQKITTIVWAVSALCIVA